MKHRMGFIGFGQMGSNYHYQIAKDRKDVCDDLSPVAVYDVRESQRILAEQRGLRAYDNIDSFLSDNEFDIVVVATPNNFHKEMTIKALNASKHVVCEKPAAMSPEELEEMIDTAQNCGKKLFIHQNRRYDVDLQLIKHAIDSGRMGKVKFIESSFTGGYMQEWRAFADHGGGILYDWGVHLIDQMVYLANERPIKVYANLNNDELKEVDDRSYIEITFKSGFKAKISVASSFHIPLPRFVVYGENTQLIVNNIYDKQGILTYNENGEYETKEYDAYGKFGAYKRTQKMPVINKKTINYPDDYFDSSWEWAKFYKAIFDSIDYNSPLPVPYKQAMYVLKIIEAAQHSSNIGMPIML